MTSRSRDIRSTSSVAWYLTVTSVAFVTRKESIYASSPSGEKRSVSVVPRLTFYVPVSNLILSDKYRVLCLNFYHGSTYVLVEVI